MRACIVFVLFFLCSWQPLAQATGFSRNRKKVKQFESIINGQLKRNSPYIWGAAGPNSFDCSGFVFFVISQIADQKHYDHNVITAKRYSEILEAKNARIECDKIQPYDILYFPARTMSRGIAHIGFYDKRRAISLNNDPKNKENPELIKGHALIAADSNYGVSAIIYPARSRLLTSHICYRNIWLEQ